MGGTHGAAGCMASNLSNRDLNFMVLSENHSAQVFRLEPACFHRLCALQGYLDKIKYYGTLFLVLLYKALGF